jgi:hypothetical protein
MSTINDRTATYIAVLTRKHDVEPELAHELRVVAIAASSAGNRPTRRLRC